MTFFLIIHEHFHVLAFRLIIWFLLVVRLVVRLVVLPSFSSSGSVVSRSVERSVSRVFVGRSISCVFLDNAPVFNRSIELRRVIFRLVGRIRSGAGSIHGCVRGFRGGLGRGCRGVVHRVSAPETGCLGDFPEFQCVVQNLVNGLGP